MGQARTGFPFSRWRWRPTKGQVASHGPYGMILKILAAANDVDNRAAVARSHYQTVLGNWSSTSSRCIAKGKEVPLDFDEGSTINAGPLLRLCLTTLLDLRCNCKFHKAIFTSVPAYLPFRH